jgi:hypothetical protein
MVREILTIGTGRRWRRRELIGANWLTITMFVGVLMLWRVMICNIVQITHIGLISHIVGSGR